MENTSKITKEQLVEFGMQINDKEGGIFPLIKKLSANSKEDGEQYLSGIAIAVTTIRNIPELCLFLDGGILFITPSSIDELKVFEKCISSWEPSY